MEQSSHQHNDKPPTIRTQQLLLGLGLLIGFLWPLYRLLNSTGWILDDELAHFMLSKAAINWPEVLLDEWARPGRNIIHSLIAPIGLTATRIYTLVLSTLAVFICYRVAILLKIRHAWSIPILLCFQPWYPELSYPVLTQAPFMLVWILAIYLALTGRLHRAAFAFGYLSLIRHEGLFISALWGLWIICQPNGILHELRHKKPIPKLKQSLKYSLLLGLSTILPILTLNLCAYFTQGHVPFAVYFDSHPTDIYGNGSLFHYLPMLKDNVGTLIILVSIIAPYLILKNKLKNWSLILLTYPAYFILHSIIFWKGSFASGGYYHFLMPMAPLFALLAAFSLSYITDNSRYPKYTKYYTTFFLLLIIYNGLHMANYQNIHQDWKNIMAGKAHKKESLLAPTDKASPHAKQLQTAIQYSQSIQSQNPKHTSNQNPITHCADVYFYYLTDQPDTHTFRTERLAPLSTFPIGSRYIWESKYANLEPRTNLTAFQNNPNWHPLKTWTNTENHPTIILFQKTTNKPHNADLPPQPKGKNLSY
ncbi:MAG: hypothetical protein ACSHX6_10915 [Akkermansiaceae bacterium]